jgi:hypothetical protein
MKSGATAADALAAKPKAQRNSPAFLIADEVI